MTCGISLTCYQLGSDIDWLSYTEYEASHSVEIMKLGQQQSVILKWLVFFNFFGAMIAINNSTSRIIYSFKKGVEGHPGDSGDEHKSMYHGGDAEPLGARKEPPDPEGARCQFC